MNAPHIQLIGYSFSASSGQNLSYEAPAAFEDLFFDNIPKEKYDLKENFLQAPVENKFDPSSEGHKIQNYENTKNSLQILLSTECRTLWKGDKPLVIGGDHSQGFATIKAALLVEVLKDLTGENPALGNSDKEALKKLADNGDFLKASDLIDSLVESSKITELAINRITSKVEVIWLDAHGDFNNKDISSSGNFHGMSAGAACGEDCEGLENIGGKFIHANPKNMHILCTRDLDTEEKKRMGRQGVDFAPYEMTETRGSVGEAIGGVKTTLNDTVAALVENIKTRGNKIIVSCDVDHMHGRAVPETGTPQGLPLAHPNIRHNINSQSPAGPSPVDTYRALSRLARDPAVIAMDMSEGSTMFRNQQGEVVAGKRTMESTLNCVLALLGGIKAITDFYDDIKGEVIVGKRTSYDDLSWNPDPAVTASIGRGNQNIASFQQRLRNKAEEAAANALSRG